LNRLLTLDDLEWLKEKNNEKTYFIPFVMD
jgi:hypothetical protein